MKFLKFTTLFVAITLSLTTFAAGSQWMTLDEKSKKTPSESDDTDNLSEMLANVPKNSTIVFVGRHVYKISKSLKFRSDLALIFQNGAVLAPQEGVTVTLDGPIEAGLQRIFTGKVQLSDSSTAFVYPQWWGAYNDGTHAPETTQALQAAIDSGHKVIVPRGTYLTNALTVKTEGTIIEGSNREKSILKFADNKGSLFNLQASFLKISDLSIEGSAKDTSSTTAGINLIKSTRSKIENVKVSGFGYGIHISDYGGNNIDHGYLYRNTRAGIYLSSGAHGVSITGGTEIAGSPFGIVLGKFRDVPFDIDYDFVHVTGQMVSVQGAIIEAIHANEKTGIGGVGIFTGMGQKGISVTNTYFEEMKVALQLGSQFRNNGNSKHRSGVLNAVFRDNFLSNVKSAIKVGRSDFGEITNNHCAQVENFFDTSEAGLFEHMKVEGNYGYTHLLSKPFDANFGKQ